MVTMQFTILLVEDDPAHAQLVKIGFGDLPIPTRIFHVSDGESALDYLHGRGEYSDRVAHPVPHIVLLDLRLPRIDGLEVLKQVKASEELAKIPIIVLTTSNARKDIRRAYEDHSNSYLVKPMDFEGYLKLTNELGTYWLETNRLANREGAPGN